MRGLRQFAFETDDRHGERPDWPAARGESCGDAAPADRGLDGDGEERLSERADHVHAVQGHAGRDEDGDGGPEAAGAGALREYSPPDRAGGYGPEGGFERSAQRHARDGAPAEAAGAAGRAQY